MKARVLKLITDISVFLWCFLMVFRQPLGISDDVMLLISSIIILLQTFVIEFK